MSGPSALQVREVTVRYGGVAAVADVSLALARGTISGLIGPNGSGKTTLLSAISGGRRPDIGSIILDDVDVTRWRPWRLARAGMARTFQGTRLVRGLTVVENVLLGAEWRAGGRRATSAEWANEAMELCGISDLRGRDPFSMSYGTRRLVEIARAVATGPSLLLLDEPTAGMNDTERAEIENVQVVLRDRGVTQLLVEHHMGMVSRLCSDVFVLNTGTLIAHGSPDEVSSDPVVREAYLGTKA